LRFYGPVKLDGIFNFDGEGGQDQETEAVFVDGLDADKQNIGDISALITGCRSKINTGPTDLASAEISLLSGIISKAIRPEGRRQGRTCWF
jgi:hypothetical protein